MIIWIIQSILCSAIVLVATFFLFDVQHIELNDTFFYVSILPAVLIMIIFYFIFKCLFPKMFSKYKVWHKNASYHLTCVLTGIQFGIWALFFSQALSCFNQYHADSLVITIDTQVIKHYTTRHRRGGRRYYTVIYTPKGIFKLDNQGIYNELQTGDRVIVKIQKGRFTYFPVYLKIMKNKHELLL